MAYYQQFLASKLQNKLFLPKAYVIRNQINIGFVAENYNHHKEYQLIIFRLQT